MFKEKCEGVDVSISLNNGVFVFDKKSSTGKTRLFYLLRKLQAVDSSILTFTFSDFSIGMDISLLVNKASQAKLVFLDRYDMYASEGRKLLESIPKGSTVLIDCKGSLLCNTVNWELCFIDMTASSIEVSL